MSLVNKMLKDLSERERASSDVMQGIAVSEPEPRPGGLLGRVVGLVVIVALVTAGLWFVYGPKPTPVPQVRASLKAAVAEAPPVVPAPAPAPAPAVDPVISPDDPPAPMASQAVAPPETETAAPPTGVEDALRAGSAAQVERSLIKLLVANRKLHPAREALVDMRIEQGRVTDARRSLNIGLGVAPEHLPYQNRNERLRRLERAARKPVAPAPTPAPTPASKPDPEPKAAPIPPADPATAEGKALELIASGRANEAATLVSRTSEAYPNWPGYARIAARIELARDRPEAAVALLGPNSPSYAADPEHHGLMASAYQRLDRHDDASRVYRALLNVQPDEGRWWAGYAISREALGDRSEAVQGYGEALKRGNLDHRVRSYVTERLDSLRKGN